MMIRVTEAVPPLGLLTALASPIVALVAAAVLGGIGTLLVALAEPVRAWRPEEERHAMSILGALESRGVVTIIGLSACLGLGFGGTEVGFPAFAEGHGGAELGSIPLALFAGGSLVGGLVAGAMVTMSPLRAARLGIEAFAWITTAVFAGFSVGMALGRTLIDHFGVKASFGLGAGAVGLGALLVAVGPGLDRS